MILRKKRKEVREANQDARNRVWVKKSFPESPLPLRDRWFNSAKTKKKGGS